MISSLPFFPLVNVSPQVLEKVPAKDSKIFYVMYANLEEDYGLARHAMAVYDRACKTVSEEDRFTMCIIFSAIY